MTMSWTSTLSNAALFLAVVGQAGVSAEDARKKPNFLIIQPDDLNFFEPWVPPPHYESTRLRPLRPSWGIPNLQRLRTQGLEMRRAHTASPMCGTSRYSTMTGRLASRSSRNRDLNQDETVATVTIPTTKVEDTPTVPDGNDCTEHNMAQVFRKNGYRTGVVGKWHLSVIEDDPYDYHDVQELIQGCGFDDADAVYPENLRGDWNDGSFSHNMEYLASNAIKFMDQAMEEEKPFFLYFNPTVVHNSGNVLEALTELNCTQTPEGILEREPVVPGMTAGIGCEAYRETILTRGDGDTTNNVLGSIWLDDTIGALLLHLETIGQLDNTMIVFQMDHGQEGKSSMYEPGLRIAQFIHYPDAFAPGMTFDGLVSTIDVGPTMMHFAGIDSLSPGYYPMDGMSWKNAVLDESLQASWENRCIVHELDQDRVILCGCDKLLVVNGPLARSNLVSEAETHGLAVPTAGGVANSVLLSVCDESGTYVTSPNNLTEDVAITDQPALMETMRDVARCHIDRTNPNLAPDYDITCGAQADEGRELDACRCKTEIDVDIEEGVAGFTRTVLCPETCDHAVGVQTIQPEFTCEDGIGRVLDSEDESDKALLDQVVICCSSRTNPGGVVTDVEELPAGISKCSFKCIGKCSTKNPNNSPGGGKGPYHGNRGPGGIGGQCRSSHVKKNAETLPICEG